MPGDVALDTSVVVAHLRNDKTVTQCAFQHALPLAARDPHFKRIQDLALLAW